jgi:hypothetical protein
MINYVWEMRTDEEIHLLLSWWIRAVLLRAACTLGIQNCFEVLEMDCGHGR